MKTESIDELRTRLRSCLSVPRWIDEVAARAPFDSAEELLRVAREAASPLSRAEVDAALAEHPRIGDTPLGDSRASRFSRGEQASADADDAELAAALAAGNRAYEEKFGRVFLIRAAGRSRAEIVAELNRRLGLADDEEARIVAAELRDIALLRLAALSAGPEGPEAGR